MTALSCLESYMNAPNSQNEKSSLFRWQGVVRGWGGGGGLLVAFQ